MLIWGAKGTVRFARRLATAQSRRQRQPAARPRADAAAAHQLTAQAPALRWGRAAAGRAEALGPQGPDVAERDRRAGEAPLQAGERRAGLERLPHGEQRALELEGGDVRPGGGAPAAAYVGGGGADRGQAAQDQA